MATAWLEFAEEAREIYPPPPPPKKKNEWGMTESSSEEEDEPTLEEEGEGDHPPNADICRVCRGTGTPERPLFHPCLCTGSIKFIHQDCLVQWLKHSGKEFCELCKHRFEFAPIYRHDMPQRLPVYDIIGGITWGTISSLRRWCHLGFVAFMWLILVPICIYRVYRFLFYRSLWSIVSFPFDLFSFNNLILDNIYGLVVVFLSLVGFISLAWLRDQLLHGGAPQWLARDQRALNQMRMREAHDSMDLLRIHLEQSSARARERAKEPDRVAAATELTELHDRMNVEVKKLQDIHTARFGVRLEQLRHREMELRYELSREDCEAIILLKGARKKFYTAAEKYKDEKHKELDKYRDETGDKEGFPAGYPSWPLECPSDLETGLTSDELLIMQLHERPRRELSDEERESVIQEMEDIRKEMMRITKEKFEYQRDVNRALRYPNVKMKKRFEPDYGSGATGFPPEDTDTGESMRRLSPEEQDLLMKIFQLKREIRESNRKEREIMGRQHDEDKIEQKKSEVRMNRWYNRLLNRHQDDPLVLMERRRNQFQRRQNLGTALAGLAREPHPAELIMNRDQEELSWSKLLGLDGSFRFLEHVVWLICLILAIILGFVYVPYQLGHIAAAIFSIWDWLGVVTWRGVVATFIGYIISGFAIVGFYYGSNKTKFLAVKTLLGQAYVVIKVAMILVVEAGIFPLMCGWWIDICSFTLFGSSMKNRQESLDRATGTVMFLHWLAGMIFIFYLASFVMLLREVLRPGVLWFLRNLNDQNFHPINEMISLPLQRHLRRFVLSCIMFGVCVMLILLIPSRLIPSLFPSFLPYNLTLTGSANPLREVQLELILLQFIVPTLLEHGNCRAGLKFLIKSWADLSARIFGLHSYLLDKPQTGGNLVDLHGKILRYVDFNPDQQDPVYTGPLQVLGPGFAPFKPYVRPNRFYIRITGFLLCTTATAVLFSSMLLITPVAIGRFVMGLFWLTNPPEIYTAAIGLYFLWLLVRVSISFYGYVTEGTVQVMTQVAFWALQAIKCVVAGFLLFVVVPLLLGHLVDLFLLSPLRVPTDRTPIFYASTEWALGLMHTKCMCGAIWLTNMRFKQRLDQVYQAGVRNLDLTFVVKKVAWPVIMVLSLSVIVPYIVFMGVCHDLGIVSYNNALFLYRFFYPFILLSLLTTIVVLIIIKQCKRLYRHVRNEKYLIGRQLVNYANPPPPISVPEEEVTMTTPVQETGEQ